MYTPQDTPASQEKGRSTEPAGTPRGSTTREVHRWLSPLCCFLPLHLPAGTTCLFQWDWGRAGGKFSASASFFMSNWVFNQAKEIWEKFEFSSENSNLPKSSFPSISGTLGLNNFQVSRKMGFFVGRGHYPAGVHTIQCSEPLYLGGFGDSVILSGPWLLSWAPTSWLGPQRDTGYVTILNKSAKDSTTEARFVDSVLVPLCQSENVLLLTSWSPAGRSPKQHRGARNVGTFKDLAVGIVFRK